MSELIRFRQDVVSKYNDWERRVILPYHIAYDAAFNSFKDTLNEQEKLDKLKTELAMAGVAIAGGTMLTATFGTALLSGLASRLSMSTIYRFELNRAFNVAAAIAGSPAAQFALTKVGDSVVTGRISALATQVMGREMRNRVNVASNTPGSVKSKMQLFAREARAKAEGLAVNVWDDAGHVCHTMAVKRQLLEDLQTTAYWSPPSRPISDGAGTRRNPSPLARRLELVFYMMMVANSDYFIDNSPFGDTRADSIPDGVMQPLGQHRAALGRSINVPPSDPNYPGFNVLTDDIGVRVASRINVLYQQETSVSNGNAFFSDVNWILDEPITPQHLNMAYRTLERIGPLCRDHVSSLAP